MRFENNPSTPRPWPRGGGSLLGGSDVGVVIERFAAGAGVGGQRVGGGGHPAVETGAEVSLRGGVRLVVGDVLDLLRVVLQVVQLLGFAPGEREAEVVRKLGAARQDQ